MSKELVKKAKELGIDNAETLTGPQLKLAIEKAEKVISDTNALIVKAIGLGIETEGKTPVEITEAILKAEELDAEIAKRSRDAEILAMLSAHFGIEDIDSLTKEEVTAILEKSKADELSGIETESEVIQEGKTDEAVKASNGLEYVFHEEAPAAFRYFGQYKTQKEWIADKDAINLMVAGKLNFLTLKK